MPPERAQTWTLILGLFSTVWPFLTPSVERATTWDLALDDLTAAELLAAAKHVLATQFHQPTPADLRDAAQGKLQWVDVWKRDAFGSVVLVQGVPVSVGRKQVRVKAGESSPVLLSWGMPDDEFAHGVEPTKAPQLLAQGRARNLARRDVDLTDDLARGQLVDADRSTSRARVDHDRTGANECDGAVVSRASATNDHVVPALQVVSRDGAGEVHANQKARGQ